MGDRGFKDEKTYEAKGLMGWALWQLCYMDMKAKGWLSGDVVITVTLKEPPHKWGSED